ncbi:endo-1,4-beta-xylanase [Sphingomonas psychrotolerans]|uniref:Beta-xylanase n=1 Tax=Sphingomonas psychrotolerans TaxID=1327635 RepID=A0ABU3N235_9SPHN|nr:endo-1,4-beta-xylanase [Sphingomonas psychrotolerans]MDT8758538.1 endo-1,4-beta-xylanase [Sphingomonas psychrotolerans]
MTGLTRREMLAATAASAIAGPALSAAQPSLSALAKAKGMQFGSCVAWSEPSADAGSFANPNYAQLLTRECGILVPENEFKWQRLRPDPVRFDVTRFADILDFAEAKGMAMRGHTLLWHKAEYFPKWLNAYDFGANPRAKAEALLTDHIRTLCRLYGDQIVSFDVVNETIDEKTGLQRETSLSRAFGDADAMVDHAFHTAREHAPKAQLVYNDYMSWEPGNEKHRAGVLRLLEGFRKRKVPVDALGIQSHIGVYGEPRQAAARQEAEWRRFLDQVAAMGYQLLITEFDVDDGTLPSDARTRDASVAAYADAYLSVLFDYPQLRDVLVWGMSDRYSWLNGFKPRADGTRKRATLYDDKFQPKPLRDVFARRFAAAAARSGTT